MKTNITIASNIVNRINDDIQRDPGFIARITGRGSLRQIKIQHGGSYNNVRLSSWQESLLRESSCCIYAKNHEMTHGLVRKNGELVWEGRCEYSLCEQFDQCSETVHFIRDSFIPEEPAVHDSAPLTYEWLGNIEALFKSEEPQEPLPEETVPPEAVIKNVKAFAADDKYEKISTPDTIINADITSKILVNAAPGSGKTYTVIHRLEHIIRARLADDFSNILVLVYTNAAKNEILTRLESGVSDGSLPYLARNVDICTFDSLATSYLATRKAKFSDLDYNGRIKLFNEKFIAEDFSNFEYIIIDELQDLVNERAKMVLNIIGASRKGYLLLGDKCQAIYDYDCHNGDSMSSVEFYKELDRLLSGNAKKFELTGNQRQINSLASLSDNIRCALLEHAPEGANKLVAGKLKNLQTAGSVEQFNFSNITKRTAILCRNNGEAEYISHLLHKKGVAHTLLRSVRQNNSLQRFIADCLWDYHAGTNISKAQFCERYSARVIDNEEIASRTFDALSEIIYNDIKETINIEKLAEALSSPAAKFPSLLLNEDNTILTVSTIHKAKGREFDTVFLLDTGFKPQKDNTEEARVWYVGCTRAKSSLFKLTKSNLYLKCSSIYTPRWTIRKPHRARWTMNLRFHCQNIAMGLPMDFSEAGFVRGDFAKALENQEYIAGKIKIGDPVAIELTGKNYHIKHNGNIVGCLAGDMFNQLLEIAKESNSASNAPPYLSPVFVSNIITITPTRFPDTVFSYFRESRFWLGIELTGFPEIDWHYA